MSERLSAGGLGDVPGGARLLCVGQDAGGAGALAPVLEQARRHEVGIVILAGEPASSLLRRRLGTAVMIEPLSANEPEARARIAEAIDSWRPGLLLVGTSHPGSPDQWATECARQRGIPSLAILDSWCNYAMRFSGRLPVQRLCYLPDVIAVMDEHARRDMLTLGVDAERVLTTGNPALDDLAELLAQPARVRATRERVAERLKLNPAARWVLFLSENGEEIYGRLPEMRPGYSEVDVFRMLCQVVPAQRDRDPQLTLVVRRHPGEHLPKYPPETESPDWLRYDDSESSGREVVLASDVVVGMTSALLVEAFLADKPVVSVQPDARSDGWLILTRLGLLRPVRSQEELGWALSAALERGASERTGPRDAWAASLLDGQATTRVVQAALRMLGRDQGGPLRHLPERG